MNNREKGSCYEKKAAAYLTANGYDILEHNFYTKHGEIDIIAKDGDYLVFIEVKYRKNDKMGTALEAVNAGKQKKIRFSAGVYMYKNNYPADYPCRFDVVGITGSDMILIKNAF